MKSVRIGSFSGPYFPHIRTEYGEILCVSVGQKVIISVGQGFFGFSQKFSQLKNGA